MAIKLKYEVSKELTEKALEAIEIARNSGKMCEEKGTSCVLVKNKMELGAAAGLQLGCSAVAVIEPGNSQDLIKEINDKLKKK